MLIYSFRQRLIPPPTVQICSEPVVSVLEFFQFVGCPYGNDGFLRNCFCERRVVLLAPFCECSKSCLCIIEHFPVEFFLMKIRPGRAGRPLVEWITGAHGMRCGMGMSGSRKRLSACALPCLVM